MMYLTLFIHNLVFVSISTNYLLYSATYAGLFTIASYTICPSLLQIFSTRLMVQMGLPTKTQYSTVFSSERVAWTVVLFGIVLIFYAMIGLAIQV